MQKIKVLFIRPWKSSFIQNDLEILRKHFDVKVLDWKGIKNPRYSVELFRKILWADITFSWFAGPHAFWVTRLSKILGKKSIVVVGGYEVAKVPEIDYGAMLNPKSAHQVRYILKNADKILAVSKFSEDEILQYTHPKNVDLIYNGIDCDKFKPESKKENSVITVAYAISHDAIKVKGLKTFIKSAEYLPNTNFLVIGELLDSSAECLKTTASSNVEFCRFVPEGEVVKYYQKARVYCQLSFRESFGMSLAEAMACECVPVVTNRGALPEVVGETGVYVPYGDPKATAEAIKKALKLDKGKEARERIKRMFSLEKREKRLVSIIEDMGV